MADPKTCPKCNGSMKQGRIMKYNEYSAQSQYMYVFSPDDDPGPELSNMFTAKMLSRSRKPLAAYCCEKCGFTEFYGLTLG